MPAVSTCGDCVCLCEQAAEDLKLMFPTPCTVRKALTCYCSLMGPPSKQLVSYLACYAEKSDEVLVQLLATAYTLHYYYSTFYRCC